MKVPDKIYLAENDKKAGETNISFWSLTPFSNHRSIKYICKDALLEWLIEQRDCSVYTDQGAYEAFQEIIDKINSM